MTQEDVFIEMACQAFGGLIKKEERNNFIAFAKLVAKHTLSNIDPSKFMSCQEVMEAARLAEREACAKLCEDMDSMSDYYGLRIELVCAEAIRARGDT